MFDLLFDPSNSEICSNYSFEKIFVTNICKFHHLRGYGKGGKELSHTMTTFDGRPVSKRSLINRWV